MSRLLAAIGLAAIVVLLWCLALGRTSRAAFDVPVDYSGDSLGHTLAYLKAAADGHVRPVGALEIPELNAPFSANWNDFPRQHKLQFWLAGFGARVLGLFATANLLLLTAHVLAGLSFFAVASYLRVRLEWALAGALAFAFSPYLSYRSLAHLNLAFDWPIPLGVLVVAWCFARRPIVLGSVRFWAAAAVAAATGLHHAYYAGFLAQFLVLAAATQLLRGRGLRAALPPALLTAVLVLVAAVDNLGSFAYARHEGPNPASVFRPYGNLERFALKPVELVLPPEGFALPPLRRAAAAYYGGAIYRGEMGSAYLGLVGIAALGWLAAVSFRAARGTRPGRVPSAFIAVLWALAYSVVGGLNAIVGAFGFVWLRATNRFSIWILAVVLLWARSAAVASAARKAALGECFRGGARRHAGARRPTPASLESRDARGAPAGRSLRPRVRALDRRRAAGSFHAVRAARHGESRRDSPWAKRRHTSTCVSTSTRRPCASATAPTRAGRARRGSDTPRRWSPRSSRERFERIGFAGVLVNRKGYEDGARQLRSELAASGREQAWESSDGDFLFVPLRPAPDGSAPDTVIQEIEAARPPREDAR